MDSIEKDFTPEKIKLIYEFNNNSPLFARVAANLLNHGNILEALSILSGGISNYDKYPSPLFILALANAYSGDSESARSAARKGAALIGSNEVLDYYFEKIDRIIKERNSITKSKSVDFDEPTSTPAETEPSIDDQLEVLAAKLTCAKINYKPDEHSNDKIEIEEYKGEKIASETLAEIYFSQKNYNEALSVYKELIKKNPNKADDYILKVAELQNIIDEQSGIILI
ncbi:MAG: tetratricopeptide repeat protein [Melioribacteraceae bacterium]|nr:tetratricopeptide repeat protein [Melioribacteraceae bacterium]